MHKKILGFLNEFGVAIMLCRNRIPSIIDPILTKGCPIQFLITLLQLHIEIVIYSAYT